MIKLKSQQRPVSKIGTSETELKYVLKQVPAGKASTKEIVDFCQEHTQTPRVYIKAAVESFIQAIVHYTMLGYRMELEDLGTFYVTAKGKSVTDNAEAGLSQLEELNIKFTPKKSLEDKVRMADVEFDGIYKLVDAEKKIYEKIKATDDGEEQPGSSNSGGGGNGDDLVG